MKCGIYGDTTRLVSSDFCSNLFISSCTSMHHAFNRSDAPPDFRIPISRSQRVQLAIALPNVPWQLQPYFATMHLCLLLSTLTSRQL